MEKVYKVVDDRVCPSEVYVTITELIDWLYDMYLEDNEVIPTKENYLQMLDKVRTNFRTCRICGKIVDVVTYDGSVVAVEGNHVV